MKAQFKVGVGEITSLTPEVLQQPLHPSLLKKLSESPPGLYELEIIKVPNVKFKKGVWAKKSGTKIIKVQ